MERSGSQIKTTGESIVREHRSRFEERPQRVLEVPAAGVKDFASSEAPLRPQAKRSSSLFERAVRVFLLIATGWLLGYLHHFMAVR
jgi:hypothetical protein